MYTTNISTTHPFLKGYTLHIFPKIDHVQGCPPDFGRSVNPISTRGDRLCPPQIFRPSDGPVLQAN